MEKERDQNQPSYVDRANEAYKNALRLKKAYKKARRLRTAANVVRGVRAGVATIQTAAATWEIWVPALIIGLIVFLIITTVVIIFGGTQQNVNAGTPQDCATIGGTCSSQTTCSDVPDSQPDATSICSDTSKPTCCSPKSSLTCDPDNPALSLSQNFNVTAATTDKSQLLEICAILAIPSQSSSYQNLLKRAGPTRIDFNNNPCGATVHADGSITLKSFFTGCNAFTRKWILIHETGHVLAINYGGLWDRFFASSGAYYPHDPTCYTVYGGSYYLRTYPAAAVGGGGGGKAESFAESLLAYVLPSYASGKGLNYQSSCPVGFSWEKSNIFGDYVF